MTSETKQNSISFTLDGKEVSANHGETIWSVAKRNGTTIPHLCHKEETGYRADGNCRACMCEVEGERVLAASCIRPATEGMVVNTNNQRVESARKMVFELLASDMPSRDVSPDSDSDFWQWTEAMGVQESRFDATSTPKSDLTNPAIAVNLAACIKCGLCVRACREVQVNDVIGMAGRGAESHPVFDFDDEMGLSSCVTCGECVQACPTGALFEKTLMDEANLTRTIKEQDIDKTVESVCPFCGVGCLTDVSVKDNKIVRIDGRDGPANENRLCVKGRFGYDYVASPDRLTHPLIRRDDAPKRGDIYIEPQDIDQYFRRASWEEALERAAQGLIKVHAEKGGRGIAGFGSAKGSNEEAYLFQKFIRQGFGTNNVDHCTRLCHASSVAALLEGIGSGAVTAPFKAALEADCIILIGCRPAQNHPVAATYFKQAVKQGAKLVLMDPRGQDLGRHAAYNIQFKSGRDVALIYAMIHVIIDEGLEDRTYIDKMVDGYEALKAKVADFSPEAMSEVCGIDADIIRQVARLYATSDRSIIFWGMGVSQHVHGTDNVRALIALATLTGQIGRAGTGLHPLRGQNNVQGASDAGLIPMFYPNYQSVEQGDIRSDFEDAWGRSLDPVKGLTVVEIMDDILRGGISGMYIMGENPAMSDPDQHHARAALAKLDHLVVQDIFLTETAWHADVILPASAHAEKLGTYTNTNREIQIGRPALDPPGEARQDWELIVTLANMVGLNWHYDSIKDVFDEMCSHMASFNNISWDRIEREGTVTYPSAAPDEPGQEILFGDGFPTQSGKVKLVPTDLLPPDELPDTEFPFVLTTGRLLEHWHTGAMTRRASALDAIEPEATVAMHPKNMRQLGIHPGEMVTVETRRGAISLMVRQDRTVSEGMLFIPFCFREAAANFLTNPKLDPYGKIPEFKVSAARVSVQN